MDKYSHPRRSPISTISKNLAFNLAELLDCWELGHFSGYSLPCGPIISIYEHYPVIPNPQKPKLHKLMNLL
jgi:hypothetical protein